LDAVGRPRGKVKGQHRLRRCRIAAEQDNAEMEAWAAEQSAFIKRLLDEADAAMAQVRGVSPVTSALPRSWEEIAVGHMVLVHESPAGWWEATVLKRVAGPAPSLAQVRGRSFVLRIKHKPLAVDHLAVLHDRNVNARAALDVDELDSLEHRVGVFPAVIERLEPKTAAVQVRILRTFFGGQLLKSTPGCPRKTDAGPSAPPTSRGTRSRRFR